MMSQIRVPHGCIFKNVVDAMQDAEEIGGQEGQDYIAFLEAIIAEAHRRIEAFRANSLESDHV
jgi:hypothetical protein